MIYQCLFIRIILIVLLATPLYCQATDVPIKIHITDKESGAPIQGYKVSLTSAYFGNATAAIQPIATLGLTDDCGNLTATAPLDKAYFGVHGGPVDSTFILLFEHCAYGQFYKEVPAFAPLQEYEVSKPFVYELKVSTDESKSFIKLDWKAHNSTIPVYVASGYEDRITVKPGEKIGRAFSLTVSSVLGQQLYSIQNPTLSKSGELILDLSVLPAGLQILELRTKTSRQVIRISKVR